mgnify:CR=1 FL=1
MKVIVLSFPFCGVFPLKAETLFSCGFVFWPPKDDSGNQHNQEDDNGNSDDVSSPILFQKKTPMDGFYNGKEAVFLIINLKNFSSVRIDVRQFVDRKFIKIIPLIWLMLVPIDLIGKFLINRNIDPVDRILLIGLLIHQFFNDADGQDLFLIYVLLLVVDVFFS